MREGLYGFERALGPGEKGGQKKVGILGSTGEALHTLFTNAVHFLFGSWMRFILSQLPFHLMVMPATLTVFMLANSWSTASTLNSREWDWNNVKGQGSSKTERCCFPTWGHCTVPRPRWAALGTEEQRLLSYVLLFTLLFCLPHLTVLTGLISRKLQLKSTGITLAWAWPLKTHLIATGN